jgi:hypothetical protein
LQEEKRRGNLAEVQGQHLSEDPRVKAPESSWILGFLSTVDFMKMVSILGKYS